MVTVSVYYIAITRGAQMFGYTANNIENVEVMYDLNDTSRVPVNQMSKPLLNIWEGAGDKPKQTVELNRESKKYINVFAENVIYNYKDGKEIKKIVKYPINEE